MRTGEGGWNPPTPYVFLHFARVKTVRGEFLENIQKSKFWFDIFEQGQILRPFSGLAASKLKISKKNVMVAYV